MLSSRSGKSFLSALNQHLNQFCLWKSTRHRPLTDVQCTESLFDEWAAVNLSKTTFISDFLSFWEAELRECRRVRPIASQLAACACPARPLRLKQYILLKSTFSMVPDGTGFIIRRITQHALDLDNIDIQTGGLAARFHAPFPPKLIPLIGP